MNKNLVFAALLALTIGTFASVTSAESSSNGFSGMEHTLKDGECELVEAFPDGIAIVKTRGLILKFMPNGVVFKKPIKEASVKDSSAPGLSGLIALSNRS